MGNPANMTGSGVGPASPQFTKAMSQVGPRLRGASTAKGMNPGTVHPAISEALKAAMGNRYKRGGPVSTQDVDALIKKALKSLAKHPEFGPLLRGTDGESSRRKK